MFFLEPPRSDYDLNFSVLGIPVRVHPLFWLVALLLGGSGGATPRSVLIWVCCLFVSILWHEMGHALMARAFGFQPHIVLYGMGGLAIYQPRQYDPLQQIMISLAGPGAGFILAAMLLIVLAIVGHPVQIELGGPLLISFAFPPSLFDNLLLVELVHDLLFINIFWGLVNLLPIFPLDGGQIARDVSIWISGPGGVTGALMLSIVTSIAVAVYAFTTLSAYFMALFFAYLAFNSYTLLKNITGGGYR